MKSEDPAVGLGREFTRTRVGVFLVVACRVCCYLLLIATSQRELRERRERDASEPLNGRGASVETLELIRGGKREGFASRSSSSSLSTFDKETALDYKNEPKPRLWSL